MKILRNAFYALALLGWTAVQSSSAAGPAANKDNIGLRVTLLGTGVPVPNPRQFGPSILVEAGDTKLLFDCGRGCLHRLWNLGPEYLRDTHRVFLTHLHSDHTVGMADLYLNGWNMNRKKNLEIYGPHKTGDLMRHLRLAFEQDVIYRADRQASSHDREDLEYTVTEVKNGTKYKFGDVTVTAFDVDHHVIKPAFGYRIDYAGRSVVISGDTAYSSNLIAHSRDVDVLIHEVFSPALERFVRENYPKYMADDIVALHTLAPEVGRVFTETRTRLGVFTHLDNHPDGIPELIAETRQTWEGPLEVGVDLMVINIGDEIDVHRPAQLKSIRSTENE